MEKKRITNIEAFW
nr:unnamed protein product [Callosobruchus analis]